jgi:hypothetical protein
VKNKVATIEKPAKKANRVAEDAAQKAGKTEQKYEDKRGIFTK